MDPLDRSIPHRSQLTTVCLACLVVSVACSGPRPAPGASGHAQSAVSPPFGPAITAPTLPGAGAANPAPQAMTQPTAGVSGDDCNKVEIEFAPRVPSVFILVDRSSSMFERSLWNPLKEGVLAVVDALDDEIRFGFSAYTGAQGMQCPELTSIVPFAEQNYATIKRAYDAVMAPQYKGETPTSLAVQEVSKTLLKEAKESPKYIVLVTDGEPDFCDDPNPTCSRDAVVAAVQSAYAQGVGTLVFSIGGQVDRAHVRDVANAGAGQPVEDRQMAVHYQCPASTATYAAASGSASFFEPDVTDRAALVSALSNAIAGARSCVFDLQGRVKVDLALAGEGVVELDGKRIAYSTADGYRMNSETQLELLGAACTQLKQPTTQRVLIDFPCKAIELL
jgi:uncharacterized protein YegL